MKISTLAVTLVQALAVSAAAIGDLASVKRAADKWNAEAWSNFVKVYAVDDTAKRDVENWNAAAWSNFVKVYAVDDTVKRDGENWNAAAWSNFIKSYVQDFTAEDSE
ncbi:hypothetical protein N7537_003891 [Penicillium hordei]|uniref:Uncharacterized protein n=1 Tax=Penicillium hordei TaxID=40994 RepID=A0AAD6H6M8_9EURO|nr:uncharacterized protein N7537_003891 [Penicillium hordei]KAJ5607272.1 hypothetical protein N7537_003891 [Penicillium hordei]